MIHEVTTKRSFQFTVHFLRLQQKAIKISNQKIRFGVKIFGKAYFTKTSLNNCTVLE